MRENSPVQTRFLLGPAGSGKTFRCLEEIRAVLRAAPEGPPLILLAPKQATFQLERQLLDGDGPPGYTRLQILSFERLARFILEEFAAAPPPWLDDEGRVMVLRALLAEQQPKLKLFRATARLPGFAQQLSLLLREFQRARLAPSTLAALARREGLAPVLRAKLEDLALLLGAYLDWLAAHDLKDADGLLDLATETLTAATPAVETLTEQAHALLLPLLARNERGEGRGEGQPSKKNLPHPSPLLPSGEEREKTIAAHSKIKNQPSTIFHLSGLWLDGFAEMTPQELELLAAVVPRCEHATLAFCLEAEPREDASWLSTWSVVSQTFRRCQQRLAALPGVEISVETLPRDLQRGRFSQNPALAHLEKSWTNPQPFADADVSAALRVAVCANPEAEAVCAAREILRHVRAGGRYRDCAVLLRSLDAHQHSLRRVFARYEIPFFLDQREPVSHHPLAELTRFALRVAAYNWPRDDWFGALKTGLAGAGEEEIDWLETSALKHGWTGAAWRQPLKIPGDPALEQRLEPLRKKLLPPFEGLHQRLAGARISGVQLAGAVREFWDTLCVEAALEDWTRALPAEIRAPVHQTVWLQMQAWLENLERAFPPDAPPLALRDWLPVLEAGLAGLTVGVIPPSLDQVLIGAVDRSRNPDLQLALVLGLNESVFPAPPARAILLTESDRAALENELARAKVFFSPGAKMRLGHERYFGYIACTRARQRLVLTCAAGDDKGKPLNPSPFLAQVRQLFPALIEETFATPGWTESEHACELFAPLLRSEVSRARAQPDPQQCFTGETPGNTAGTAAPLAGSESLSALAALPFFAGLLARGAQLAATRLDAALSPATAEKIYGTELKTSVSKLEDFPACPFKFFVKSGLHAGEREEFEVDHRRKGSFQHELLKAFHLELKSENRQWRDLTPEDAVARVARLGERLLGEFDHGLFLAGDADRFTGHMLIAGIQKLMRVLIGWMPQYGFDPRTVEVSFGLKDSPLPAWRLDLGAGHALVLRGQIDRVDLCRTGDDEALAVVVDYKSSGRKLDAVKLQHGLELQLLSYLGVLRQLSDPRGVFDVARLLPAGVFYVNLRGNFGSAASRAEVLAAADETRRLGYQHTGRFNAGELRRFDNREAASGDQFNYRRKKDGGLHASCAEALPGPEFLQLVGEIETHLTRLGREIYQGNVKVEPFAKGGETACDHCEYRGICRFDPWVDRYRVLRAPPKGQSA